MDQLVSSAPPSTVWPDYLPAASKAGGPLQWWRPTALQHCITLSLHSRSISSLLRENQDSCWLCSDRLTDWREEIGRASGNCTVCEWESPRRPQNYSCALSLCETADTKRAGITSGYLEDPSSLSSHSSIGSLNADMHTSTLNTFQRKIDFLASVHLE